MADAVGQKRGRNNAVVGHLDKRIQRISEEQAARNAANGPAIAADARAADARAAAARAAIFASLHTGPFSLGLPKKPKAVTKKAPKKVPAAPVGFSVLAPSPPGSPRAVSPEPPQSRGRSSASSSRARSESPTPSSATVARTTLLLEASLTKERALVHGSCTDSWHDFHTKKGYNTTGIESNDSYGLYDTKYGIPIGEGGPYPVGRSLFNNADSLHTEVELLQELFKGYELLNPEAGDGKPRINLCESAHPKFFTTLLATKLEERLKNFQNGFAEPEPFKSPSIIDGVQNHIYDIKMLHKKLNDELRGETYKSWGNAVCSVPHMTGKFRLTTDEIIDFFGASEINLLFDAGVVNVVGLIRNCKKGDVEPQPHFTVNRLINRELINDPATKTYEFNTKSAVRGGAAPNVTANILFDDEKEPVRYTKYTDGADSELKRGLFYSKYDFTLGKLQNGGDGKKRKKNQLPSVKLDIIKEDTTIYFSDNPHEQNNIKFCWSTICNIGAKDANPHEIAAVAFQCKRSGDWLQALSCFDIGRQYVRVAKATKETGNDGKSVEKYLDPEVYKLKGNNIILVTHDRVLLYYALLLGLDVLFTYKKPGVGAGDEDDEKEEEGEEEDEDEAKDVEPEPGADADVSKSKKYLIYFSNRSRQTTVPKGPALTPAELEAAKAARAQAELEKSAALLAKTKALVASDSPAVLAFINSHNGFVDEIIRDNENEIITINGKIDAATDATIGVPTISLVQSYVKLASFNYKCIDGSKYSALAAAITAAGYSNKETDALCKEFISVHEGFVTKQKTHGTKEQILEKTAYYKHNEHFKNIEHLSLTAKRTGGRERKPTTAVTSTPETSFLLMATYFVKNLAPKHLSNLVLDIKVVHDKIKADVADPSTLYTSKFINNLESLSPTGSLNAARAGPDAVGSGRCALAAVAVAAAASENEKIVASLQEKVVLLEDLHKEIRSKIDALPAGSYGGLARIVADSSTITTKKATFTNAIKGLAAAAPSAKALEGAKALLEDFDAFYKEKQTASDSVPEPEVPAPVIAQVAEAITEEQIVMRNVDKRIDYYNRIADDKDIKFTSESVALNALGEVASAALREMECAEKPEYVPIFRFLNSTPPDFEGLYEHLGERISALTYKPDAMVEEGEISLAKTLSAKPSVTEEGCDEIIGDRLFAEASSLVDESTDYLLKLVHMAHYYYDKELNTNKDKSLKAENLEESKSASIFATHSRLLTKIQKTKDVMQKLEARKAVNNDLPGYIQEEKSQAAAKVSDEMGEAAKLSSGIEGVAGKGKKITFLTTLGSTLQLVGFKMLSAANTLMEKRGQQGGGSNDTNSYLLVLLFLRQLIMAINSFNSSKNEDYKYYQGLATRVIAVCKVEAAEIRLEAEEELNDDNAKRVARISATNKTIERAKFVGMYNRLQALFFDVIPGGSSIVDFIGRQVALQSCGYCSWDGPLPSFGNAGSISPKVSQTVAQLRVDFKGVPFVDRVTMITEMLRNFVITFGSYAPDSVPDIISRQLLVEAGMARSANHEFQKAASKNLAQRLRNAGLVSSVPVPLGPRAGEVGRISNFPSSPVTGEKVLVTSGPVRRKGGRKTRKLKKRRQNKTVRRLSRSNKKK